MGGLNDVLSSINNKYGKGMIHKMTNDYVVKVPTESSGSLELDIALGGGIATGRIVEIMGPESSGKTSVALAHIAKVQSKGGVCSFIDMEQALDPNYARKLGVNMDELIFTQPDYGEQALDIVETLVASGEVDCIVIDSVATLTPKAEIEGEMGDSKMGLHARLMSQALRKLSPAANKNNCTLIFINQLREKIGIMFGKTETTTGGNALKFYASQRIDVRKQVSQADKAQDGTLINVPVNFKVIKNKIAPPFSKGTFTIIFNEGIDKPSELLSVGNRYDLVKKAGSHYSYGDIKLGNSKANAREFLIDNADIAEEIENKIMDKLKQGCI